MHRHLLGLTSPPADHVPDRFAATLGLPEGWDGDARVKSNGRACFLRAWHAATGRVAYGGGVRFEDARRDLLNDMADGTRRVKVSIQESKPARLMIFTRP